MRATALFGFLGAGKTSVLAHWLAAGAPPPPDALIVNEFGALGFDGERLARAGLEAVEISGGCICCELLGSLRAAVETFADDGVETLWIEASGVSRPQDLVAGLDGLCDVEAALTMVDASRFAAMRRLGPFYEDQVRGAGAVAINKIDLAPADVIQATADAVRALNPGAALFFVERGRIDRASVSRPPAGREPGGHGAHVEAESCLVEAPAALSLAALGRFFAGLPDTVWRAKGVAVADGSPRFVNWAHGRLEIEDIGDAGGSAPPERRRLVLIGRALDCDALARALADAARGGEEEPCR